MGGREHGAREDERMCVYYGFTAGGPAQRSPGRVHAQRQTNIDEKVFCLVQTENIILVPFPTYTNPQ